MADPNALDLERLREEVGQPGQLTVLQHYVPVCYLEKFTDSTGGFHVLDKRTEREFRSGPKAVAAERRFYELAGAEVDSTREVFNELQLAERSLQIIEGEFSRHLNLFISEAPYIGVSEDVRRGIARYMVIQHLRSERTRRRIVEMHNAGLTVWGKAQLEHKSGPGTADNMRLRLNPADEALAHLQALFDPEFWDRLEPIFLGHIWLCAVAPDGTAFSTSDHPIALKIPNGMRGGLGSPGVEIAFPVSSRLCLLLKDRGAFSALEHLDGKVIQISEADVTLANRMQAASARRWIFHVTPDFADLRRFCRSHPFLLDTEREDLQTIYHKGRRTREGKGQLVQFTGKPHSIDWYV